jgi:hypothetical protein
VVRGRRPFVEVGDGSSRTTTRSSRPAWRDAWEDAVRWAAYCSEQRRVWEDDSLAKIAAFRPVFDYLAAAATRYPATRMLVGARSASARRGAAKKKNEKKEATVARKAPALTRPGEPPASAES